MEIAIMILFIIAIFLFILSFFLPDSHKDIKEELEQLSLQFYQETYELKRRIHILEEELLITDGLRQHRLHSELNPIIINQVKMLAQQGLPVEQIAKQSALSVHEVQAIIGDRKGWQDDE